MFAIFLYRVTVSCVLAYARLQVRDIWAEEQHRANRNTNSPEQFIETAQYNQAALIHFPYLLTHFQGHGGAWADPREGRTTPWKVYLYTPG